MSSAEQIRGRPPRRSSAVLLEACGLPFTDLLDGHMRHFFYVGPQDSPSGIVGIELCGRDALLRSLAVRETERGTGLGGRLVAHAEGYARAQGANTIYLLTTTAERFFRRQGYATAPRDDAPEGIRTTREFADICPASSVFMFKPL